MYRHNRIFYEQEDPIVDFSIALKDKSHNPIVISLVVRISIDLIFVSAFLLIRYSSSRKVYGSHQVCGVQISDGL